MGKKRSSRPHGHYCKICGEYQANEKFSGKGHAAHICKACSKLSAAGKAEAMTINRLMNFPMGRLSDSDRAWLENRVHDHRPEVASLAREVYNIHFPYAERNKRKKRLIIDTLLFELHTEVFDEYGNAMPVHQRFTAGRKRGVLTMTDFGADGMEQTVTVEPKKLSTMLRWAVHSLEIFMWAEDYSLSPDGPDPYSDILPEHLDENREKDGLSDAPAPEPASKIKWRVHIEYADRTQQEIASYQDPLPDRPEELYVALLEYFQPDTGVSGDEI